MIIKADSAEIQPSFNHFKHEVSLNIFKLRSIEIDRSSFESDKEIDVLIENIGDAILDRIGKERVMEYFNLVERE